MFHLGEKIFRENQQICRKLKSTKLINFYFKSGQMLLIWPPMRMPTKLFNADLNRMHYCSRGAYKYQLEASLLLDIGGCSMSYNSTLNCSMLISIGYDRRIQISIGSIIVRVTHKKMGAHKIIKTSEKYSIVQSKSAICTCKKIFFFPSLQLEHL